MVGENVRVTGLKQANLAAGSLSFFAAGEIHRSCLHHPAPDRRGGL
jgi:hypothetical protein